MQFVSSRLCDPRFTLALIRSVLCDLFVGTGMSVSVPIFGDPRDLLLETLPFVHARARDQCLSATRRMFDATAERRNVQIMLNLATLNGPTLLAMVANVVRTESSALVILTGHQVDSGLVGLLRASESVTSDSDIQVQLDYVQLDCASSETDVSSMTEPSEPPSSDTSSRDPNSEDRRLQCSSRRATDRQRYTLQAAGSKLREAGAFMSSGREKIKGMLAMYFLLEHSTLEDGVVRLIGEFCWVDGWRGAAGGGGDGCCTRMSGVEADAVNAAVVTRLAFRLGGAAAVAAEAEAEAEAARQLAELGL